MSRWQFYILNLTSLALVVLIGIQFWLVEKVRALDSEVARNQAIAVINNARKIEPILRDISVRIAQASETEARFRDLLVKHGMKVTLTVDGKQKNYP